MKLVDCAVDSTPLLGTHSVPLVYIHMILDTEIKKKRNLVSKSKRSG